MVIDIQLLQGKIIEDLDQHPKNFTLLMEELALEILADEDLAIEANDDSNSSRGQT